MSIRESDLPTRQTADDPTSSFVFPGDPVKSIAWLERKRKAAVEVRPDWRPKLNLAFFFGLQFLRREDFLRGKKSTFRPNLTRRNRPVRVAVNRLAAIIEHAVGSLTSNSLVPEVRPNTTNDDDVSAARAGTAILLHEHDRIDGLTLTQDALFWSIITGWAYDFCTWDASAGPVLPLTSPDGTDIQLPLGDISREIVPPFEIAVDPSGRREDLTDARYFVRSIALTKEEVWERYGRLPTGASTTQTVSDELSFFLELGDALGRPIDRFRDFANRLVIHQLWHLPSRAAPNGLVATYSGQTVLDGFEDGEWAPFPYEHGRLPITQLSFFPGLIRREGRTWTDDLVSMQADYNDSRSRVATIRRVMTPFLVTGHNTVDKNKLSNRVQVIEVKPTTTLPPNFQLPDGRWATTFERGMERAENEMDARAGTGGAGGISGPQATSGLSAAALLALQEQSSRPLVVPAVRIARYLKRSWWQHLQLVRQFWTFPRIVATLSEESGRTEVRRFIGAELRHELDVHVSAEAALPRSKAARVQLATELLDRELIDPTTYFRFIDIAEFGVLSRTYNRAVAQANRENERLITGNQVPVRARHIHASHISAHTDLTMSREYEEASVEVQAVVDAHIQAHEEAMALAAAGLAQAQIDAQLDPARAAMVAALSPLTPPQSTAGQTVPPPANPAILGAITGGNLGGGGENPAQRRGSLATSLRSLAGPGAPGQPFQASGDRDNPIDLRGTQLGP